MVCTSIYAPKHEVLCLELRDGDMLLSASQMPEMTRWHSSLG